MTPYHGELVHSHLLSPAKMAENVGIFKKDGGAELGLLSRILMIFKAKASSAIDKAEDPREVVEYAYNQQQELLRKTKQGLIEVAASRVRLEQQAKKLQSQVPKNEEQARKALKMGREDLARIALQRKQSLMAEVTELERQVVEVTQEERGLARTEQELAARIEEFRIRRDSISARYSAAKAQVKVTEALSGVSGEFADLGMALGRAVEKTERMQARASAVGSLIETGSLALPGHGTDPVERDLLKVTVDQSVEDELAALKGQMDLEPPPAALPSGK